MRICIFRPEHCSLPITKLFSDILFETAKNMFPDVAFIQNDSDLKSNDLVLYRFGSDFQSSAYKDTQDSSKKLSEYISTLEAKGCVCLPSSYMMQFYENKERLFELFQNSAVKIPQTFIFKSLDLDLLNSINKYPVIIKVPFSCSSNNIRQAFSKDELLNILTGHFSHSTSSLIIQQKILTRKEARITYYGNHVFHGYYRIKPSEDDVSAATKFGSTCDFNIDLEKYKPFILDFQKKTGMLQGGIDIIWDNGDESTDPYVLEVSPIFDINPPTPSEWTSDYATFKKQEGYDDICKKYLQSCLHNYISYAIDFFRQTSFYIDIDNTITDSSARVKKYPTSYSTQENYQQDIPFPSFLNFLDKHRAIKPIFFITAREFYENPFEGTQAWLRSHNIQYTGLFIVNSLHDKIELLSKINENKNIIFFDDFTKSHNEPIPMIDQSNVNFVQHSGVKFYIVNNEDFWKTYVDL